jgi:hypothetical protein
MQLDPYAVSFRLVRVHVLIEENKPLDETSLIEAIRAGHCFIGFDFLGDSSGFEFGAEPEAIQGDEIKVNRSLKIRTPVPSQIVIYKDGSVFLDESGVTSREFSVQEPGVYRAEVYLPQLGNRLWIISNPIYVR